MLLFLITLENNINGLISVCGCQCSVCEHFLDDQCLGCEQIQGNVWWAKYLNAETCPIYYCVVNDKKIENCGYCNDPPCSIWLELKDPDHCDEYHKRSIDERAARLKNINMK